MNINELEGRELKYKVATEVMGITIMDGVPCKKHLGCLSHISHPCEGCGRWHHSLIPDYPSDIVAAYEVHLKMFKSDPATLARYLHALKDLLMEHSSFSIWTASLEYFDPLTICRAAVMAAEAE